MKAIILAGALALIAGSANAQEIAPLTTLIIQIQGARTQSGDVLVSIYDNEEAFPGDADKAVVKLKLSVAQAQRFIIDELPAGDYAIAIAHDENSNGKIDKNGFGIPKEGFGFSNNKMGTFGPPSFEKAKITLSGAAAQTAIKLKYL